MLTSINSVNATAKDAHVTVDAKIERTDQQGAELVITCKIADGLHIYAQSQVKPFLAAITWLFSWLIPVFWIVIFGFMWKRSNAAAFLTLIAAWVTNSLWSFTSLPSLVGINEKPGDFNAYMTLAVTLIVGITATALFKGEPGYFRSEEYRLQQNDNEGD